MPTYSVFEADDYDPTGTAVAEWLATHPLPMGPERSAQELDERIAENRASWECSTS